MNELAYNRSFGKNLERLTRATIGFDPLIRMFEDTQALFDSQGYPPYNIEKRGDDRYRITLAVAGFSSDDIDMTIHDGVLTVTGTQHDESSDQESNYLYKGIATRQFRRQFRLADYVEVESADLHNGLLQIDLVRHIPEEKRARKITIRNGNGSLLASDNEAAIG